MKKDIASREDIVRLVDEFYAEVKTDPVIGHIFTEVAQLDFGKHLPVMYQFWETTLLGIMSYKGNPMAAHIRLDSLQRLNTEHFDRWLLLWTATVDRLFTGSKADDAKTRATQIRHLMQYKVEAARAPSPGND